LKLQRSSEVIIENVGRRPNETQKEKEENPSQEREIKYSFLSQ